MAIIIPSKNIYDIKNDIVRENSIKSIELRLNKITEKVEDNSLIMDYAHQITYDAFWGQETPTSIEEFIGYVLGDPTNESGTRFEYKTETRLHTDGNTYFCVSGANTSVVNLTYALKIPKEKNGVAVTKDTKATLNISRRIKVVQPPISTFIYDPTDSNSRPHIFANYGSPLTTQTTKIDLEDLPNSVVTEIRISDDTLYSKYDGYTVEKDTRQVELFEIESDPNNYYCNLLIPALRTISIAGYREPSGRNVLTTRQIVEYVPTDISVSVYGKVYRITQEYNKVIISNPNSKGESFATQTNALMQFSHLQTYTEHIQKTLQSYENGKEIIGLKCSISDYYDEKGNIVVSAKGGEHNMIIPIYADIIPMYINGNNNEVPIAKYNDGTPKIFKVLQSKISYDGAVWQTMLAQEV